MKKYLLVIVLTFCTFILTAQQHIETSFPYRLVGGKILIDMKMNGQLRSFIFDTGGQTALTEEVCDELALSAANATNITDVNGNESKYKQVLVRELKDVNEKFCFKDVMAIVIPAKSALNCFKVDGIIGSDLMRYSIVEIDSRNKNIRIFNSGKLPSMRKMLPFARQDFMPVINLQIGKLEVLPVLFDTGCPSFLNLKDSDFTAIRDHGVFQLKNTYLEDGSLGLSGESTQAISYRVEFPSLSIGPSRFENVSSKTSSSPLTLLGIKLLDYGKVTIDYPKCRFYFELFEEKVQDLTSSHNLFALGVKNGDLCVSSVDESLKNQLSIGDRVLKINGKLVGKFDFCESITSGIPALKKKKVHKLLILTSSGEKEFIYKKQ